MNLQSQFSSSILFFVALAIGFVVFLQLWNKQQREQQAIDWLEAVFVTIVGLVVFIGWVGTLLASFGVFSVAGVSVVVLLTTGALWLWQRPFSSFRFLPLSRYEILIILVLACFAFLYLRPHEYFLGSTDAGTYVNIAGTLAQTGQFVINDDWTEQLHEYADITLRQQPPQWQTRYLQFVGWYIDNDDPTRLIPQFFPLHPVLMSFGMGLFGLMGGLFVTPLWGLMGILAVYLLTRHLFNRPTAFLASLLLGLTPTHIFFARYPTTEPLTLLLVFSSLLAFQRLWDDEKTGTIWGILGGAALGAALLTRIDLPVLVLLVLAALVLRWRQRRWSRGFTAFTLSSSFISAHAFLSAVLINWPYTWNTYSSVLRILSRSTSIIVAVSVVVLLLVLVWVPSRKGWITNEKLLYFWRSPYSRIGAAFIIIVLSIYAYFLRPIVEPVKYYPTWPGGVEIPLADGQNWQRMGWYLTPLGVLLATLGAAWLVWRKSWYRYGLFLAVGLTTTVQYIYRIFNTPYHIYAMRRYVPIAIPMLMIYATVAIVTLANRKIPKSGNLIAGFLAVGLIAGLLYQSRFVIPQRDFAGLKIQMEALNAELIPNALVIISEPPELNVADQLGVPLRFLFDHDVATIRGEGEEIRPFLNKLVRYAQVQEQPLQLITLNAIDPTIRQNLTLQPVTMVPIRTQMLANTFNEFPSTQQNIYYGVEIYNVDLAHSTTSSNLPLIIDIGTLDSLYIQDGFYYKEPWSGEITMRWTGASARLQLPMKAAATLNIELKAMIFRPELVPATPVIVSLDNQEIGQFTPNGTWKTFIFSGTATPERGYSVLEFKSATFNPAQLQLSSDGRDLGFLLDWVKIE